MRPAVSAASLFLALFATEARAIEPWRFGPIVDCPFTTSETLETCTSSLQYNTDEICGERWIGWPTTLSDWLGSPAGWDRVTLDNLARLHWWSGNSFSDDLLKFVGVPGSRTWEDFGDWISQSWRRLTVLTLSGVIAMSIGIVTLLLLVLIVTPTLLFGLFTRHKKGKPASRRPLSRKRASQYFVFHGLIILVVVVCIISMHHNANSLYDSISQSQCATAQISEGILVGDIRTSSGREFLGVSSGLLALQQASSAVNEVLSEVQGSISLREKAVAGISSLYAPIVWTDALLRAPNYFLGWSDSQGRKSVPFSLDMQILGAAQFSMAAQFDDVTGDYGILLSAAELSGTAGATEPSPEIKAAVSTAHQILADIHRDVEEALPSLSEGYGLIRQMIDTVTRWSAEHLRAAYWDVVLFSALPLLGILLAILIWCSWKSRTDRLRAGREVKPSRLLRLGSGCVIFGLLFWGGTLFIIGGGVLVASYFSSDACHFVETDLLTEGRYGSYKVFDPVSAPVVNACLTRGSTGDLIAEYGNLTIGDFQKLLSIPEIIDPSLVTGDTIGHPSVDSYISFHGVPNLIMPLNYQSLPSTDERIRWSSLTQSRVQTLPSSLLKVLTTSFPNQTMPIYGLADITDALNEYMEEAGCGEYFLCLGAECPAWAIMISPKTVYRYDLAELQTAISNEAWKSIRAGLAASTRMQQALGCVADSTLTSSTKKAYFFGGLWIAAQKAAALSRLLRVSGTLSDTSVVDICPVAEACPVFFHTSLTTGPTPQLTLIDHETWEGQVSLDTAEALSLTSSAKILELVANSAITYNSGAMAGKGLTSMSKRLDCMAVFEQVEALESALCNGPLSDVAAWGVATVVVAAMHLLGAIFVWHFWKTQKQLPRAEPSMLESPQTPNPTLDGLHNFQAAMVDMPPLVRMSPEEFLYAAEIGSLSDVRKGLGLFPPDSICDIHYQNGPLHLTSYYGHLDCTSKILEASWNVDPVNFKGNTPLMAVICNITMSINIKLQISKLLLEHGANPRRRNADHETPISAAQKLSNHQEIVALLLMHDRTDNVAI